MTQLPCGINDPAMKGREETLNAVGNPREAGKDTDWADSPRIDGALSQTFFNVLKI